MGQLFVFIIVHGIALSVAHVYTIFCFCLSYIKCYYYSGYYKGRKFHGCYNKFCMGLFMEKSCGSCWTDLKT